MTFSAHRMLSKKETNNSLYSNFFYSSTPLDRCPLPNTTYTLVHTTSPCTWTDFIPHQCAASHSRPLSSFYFKPLSSSFIPLLSINHPTHFPLCLTPLEAIPLVFPFAPLRLSFIPLHSTPCRQLHSPSVVAFVYKFAHGDRRHLTRVCTQRFHTLI